MIWLLLGLSIALLSLDWRQTLYIFKAGRQELNPVIRWFYAKYSFVGIHLYFVAWIALVIILPLAVPKFAVYALGVIAAVQLFVVSRNHRLGIPF